MFRWLAIAMLTVLVITANPPKHSMASPVNKQEEHKVEAPIVETPVPPQEVAAEVPAPQPEPVQYPIGCENYVAELQKYAWNVSVMANIMKAESGCNPYAVGDNYPINGLRAASCGLFQVRTLQGRPSCEELKDPATNIQWAFRIYQSQGYPAWSVCRTKVSCY